MGYAKDTTVPVEKTRAELERLVLKAGATSFAVIVEDARAAVGFKVSGRSVRFELHLPGRDEKRFRYTPAKALRRSDADAFAEWEQECRRLWRALLLAIRAKVEMIESGISTFEVEFLPYTVLPGGETVAQRLAPEVSAMIAAGRSGPLLLESKGGSS